MLDIAVAYNRYKFIGNEYLTWLWFVIETSPDIIHEMDSEIDTITRRRSRRAVRPSERVERTTTGRRNRSNLT